MKRSKINLAILAVLIAAGAAFTTTTKASSNRTDVLWGQIHDGSWIQTTAGAHCNASTKMCKELFPAGQDPNDDSSGGTPVHPNGQLD